MGLLDDELNRQRRAEQEQAANEARARRPASSYPPDLAQVIAEFLARRIPPDTSVGTGGKTSLLRAQLRMRQPGTMRGWELFRNNGDGMGDSGMFMLLTTDGLLRVFQHGYGFQPIGQTWSGSPLRGPHLAVSDGSLTRAVTEVLARKVRQIGR